jgi:hypothetical protein
VELSLIQVQHQLPAIVLIWRIACDLDEVLHIVRTLVRQVVTDGILPDLKVGVIQEVEQHAPPVGVIAPDSEAIDDHVVGASCGVIAPDVSDRTPTGTRAGIPHILVGLVTVRIEDKLSDA